MTILEAINLILANLGLPPIHDEATRSKPVSIIRESLDRATRSTLRTYPHRFGRRTTLSPDGQGRIAVSQYLRWMEPRHLRGRVTTRNGYVWDIKEDDYYGSEIKDAIVVEEVGFTNIDSYAWQEYIALRAATEAEQRINGPDGANYAIIYRAMMQAKKAACNETPRPRYDGTFGIGSSLRGYYE